MCIRPSLSLTCSVKINDECMYSFVFAFDRQSSATLSQNLHYCQLCCGYVHFWRIFLILYHLIFSLLSRWLSSSLCCCNSQEILRLACRNRLSIHSRNFPFVTHYVKLFLCNLFCSEVFNWSRFSYFVTFTDFGAWMVFNVHVFWNSLFFWSVILTLNNFSSLSDRYFMCVLWTVLVTFKCQNSY